MNLLQAFNLGVKCGRAEKQAEGTPYQEELEAMTDTIRNDLSEILEAQNGSTA